ncbi:MAG: phosphatidylglycerophosphatase A [Deltaproteobacteria bacterium]|nr:phosphatidylglycerophosphatase A [Deltaproteobacteria bacterium]
MAHCFPAYALLVAAFVLLLAGVKAAAVAEAHYGQSDAGQIVIDEVVGYMMAMYLVPVTCWTLAASFSCSGSSTW